ncbi:MAG TPA: sterol desaturase family protein [Gemmataceae bacterium]|nr:sterol desaturase family protein [Gemmataceae bacterium]
MEWMAAIAPAWLQTLAWLTGLAVVFGVLTRWMPCNPGMHWWKDPRGTCTNLLYLFVVPVLLRLGRTLLLAAGVALLFRGGEAGFAAVRGLPLWLQCLAVLLIEDALIYGLHRAFHTRPAWPFHAAHHSPEVLDWMASARFHPVNNLLCFTLADVAMLLLGFSPEALLVLAPFNVVYSAMVHANLNWTFGPLRYVLASPVFHRWHHTAPSEGGNKNFAATFPLLDLLFGTFYMPPGRLPERYGVDEDDFPEDFWGQFIRPFRGQGRRPAALLPDEAGAEERRVAA